MSDPFFVRRPLDGDDNSRRVAAYVWKAVASLRQTQWHSAAEIEQRQMRAFRRLLEHCVRHVPWYRETCAETAGSVDRFQSMHDMQRLPIVDRPTFQAHAARFGAESLPSNMVATGTVTTSGTSGVPVSVQQTNIVNLWWCALALRDLEWSNIDPRGRLAAIRSLQARSFGGDDLDRQHAQSTWGRPFSNWIETGPSFAIDIQRPVEEQLAWLREVNPECLLSFPSNLDALTRCALRTNSTLPNLKRIQSMAEPLTADARERIESAFSAPIRDGYSCQEVGYLASQCPGTGGFHVHAESVILEVVDDAGRPVAPGESGRVLLTSLLNYQTPLVRYEVGDEAVAGVPCACGRGLPTLVRIHGKWRPMLVLPAGGIKCSSTLADSLSSVAGFRQYQVEQGPAQVVTLRIVPGDEWSPTVEQELTGRLRRFFGSPLDVRLEIHNRIPPGPGGKTPAFITMSGRGNSAPAQ